MSKKQLFRCHGGPLDRCELILTSPGTLTFTLHGQTGRYDASMRWVPA